MKTAKEKTHAAPESPSTGDPTSQTMAPPPFNLTTEPMPFMDYQTAPASTTFVPEGCPPTDQKPARPIPWYETVEDYYQDVFAGKQDITGDLGQILQTDLNLIKGLFTPDE